MKAYTRSGRYLIIVPCMTVSSTTCSLFFFFQAEDGIRDLTVTGVQTCALPIFQVPMNNAIRMRVIEGGADLDGNINYPCEFSGTRLRKAWTIHQLHDKERQADRKSVV